MPNVKLLDKTKPKIKIEYVILRREVRQTKDEKREVDGRKTFSFKNKQLSHEVCGGRFQVMIEAILRNTPLIGLVITLNQ